MLDRHPVGHGGGERREHRVETGLCGDPADRDAQDGVLLGEQHERDRGEERAAHRPPVPAPEAGGRTVGHGASEGVEHDRGGRAERRHDAEHRLLVGRVDRLDLPGQQHLDRGEEAHPHRQVGQHQQRDPPAAHPGDRLCQCGGHGWAAIRFLYHPKDVRGVRCCVAKSTCTRPKRWVKPSAHSKLSNSDQTQ